VKRPPALVPVVGEENFDQLLELILASAANRPA